MGVAPDIESEGAGREASKRFKFGKLCSRSRCHLAGLRTTKTTPSTGGAARGTDRGRLLPYPTEHVRIGGRGWENRAGVDPNRGAVEKEGF